MVTAQDFSGLPNLDTLDLSKNSLNDESFVSNSLSVGKRSVSATFLFQINEDPFPSVENQIFVDCLYRSCVLCEIRSGLSIKLLLVETSVHWDSCLEKPVNSNQSIIV